jgi:hypothetical protein
VVSVTVVNFCTIVRITNTVGKSNANGMNNPTALWTTTVNDTSSMKARTVAAVTIDQRLG